MRNIIAFAVVSIDDPSNNRIALLSKIHNPLALNPKCAQCKAIKSNHISIFQTLG